MAMGNVIGSNISNIALVLGIAAIIRPLHVSRQVVIRDAPLALGISIILFLLVLDGGLSRLEGGLLFAGILVYVFVSFRRSKAGASELPVPDPDDDEEPIRSMPLHFSIPLTIVGLIGLVVGANIFVDGAKRLAEIFSVPEAVVGLTLMAVGTSLPEIATVVAASLKGYSDIITGNAIGSNIFNLLCVLGITSLVLPLTLGAITMVDLVVFLASAALICIALATGRSLTRIEGIILIVSYFGYVYYLY
jgi:cation:H+ antiporter